MEEGKDGCDELYSAIKVKLGSEKGITVITSSLMALKNGIALGQYVGEAGLENARSTLCDVCRVNELYSCDMESGWSKNCAFIQTNNTRS